MQQLSLLLTKRFLPLFITQFLGAFNDNLFKNALIILITYHLAEQIPFDPQITITIAAGLFTLPFFLFSATAGQLADKYEKSRLIRYIKFVEILVMIGASVGFYVENTYLLMTILFLMGTQSSFFGPLKYSILPEHLAKHELIGGNALVGAATFLAILLGTIVGGLFILTTYGPTIIATLIITIASLGWTSSLCIPRAQAANPNLSIHYNIIKETWKILSYAHTNKPVFLSIIGISWFWFIGAVFLAQFPNYTKATLGGNEEIVTLFLTIFSIGIAIGSLLCNRLLKGAIHATYAPYGIITMSIFIIDLYIVSQSATASSTALIGFTEFIKSPSNWRIVFDLLMISIAGGIYIVPLYAIMQHRSEQSHRARVVASNNVMNACFMVLSAILSMTMLSLHFSVTDIFLSIAIANGILFFITRKIAKQNHTEHPL